MKPNATLWERFEGWFLKPIEKLKECPEGDGAFLALSAALFLCERYYRTVTNTHEGSNDNLSFRNAAAQDLGIAAGEFEIFWKVFRHGLQHQGMPKRYTDGAGVEYRWNIGEAYQPVPIFVTINPNLKVITINPWTFAALIASKYQANQRILANATVHVFGQAFA